MDESSRIDELERKVEELGKRLEKAGERFGERVEEFAEEFSEKMKAEVENEFDCGKDENIRRRHNGDSFFWGVILIAIGTIWIGNNLHWFTLHIGMFPAILILIGFYILVRSPRR